MDRNAITIYIHIINNWLIEGPDIEMRIGKNKQDYYFNKIKILSLMYRRDENYLIISTLIICNNNCNMSGQFHNSGRLLLKGFQHFLL